jgi:hydrogenase maturation protease
MKILVLALGNDLMGDDIAGFLVADELMKRLPPEIKKHVDIVKTIESGFKLIDYFTMEYDHIYVIDSIIGDEIGKIYKVLVNDVSTYKYPSLHWMGIPHIISMLRETLDRLPDIEIYGIVIGNIEIGSKADEKVFDAAMRLSDMLIDEIRSALIGNL